MIDEENQLDNAQTSAVTDSESASNLNASSESSGQNGEFASDIQSLSEENSAFEGGGSGIDASVITAAENGDESAIAAIQKALLERDNEIRDLKAQLDARMSEVEERTTQLRRNAADFDNFRKRTQREREELEQQIKCNTINELLPVVDNFERARSQFKPQTDQETTIHKGYQGVYKQLVECLKRIGVAPMRAEGKEFDPNLHEAVMRQPTNEYPEGTVIEELQRGYMLGERVLRHALVKVATAPEPETASDASEQTGQEG